MTAWVFIRPLGGHTPHHTNTRKHTQNPPQPELRTAHTFSLIIRLHCISTTRGYVILCGHPDHPHFTPIHTHKRTTRRANFKLKLHSVSCVCTLGNVVPRPAHCRYIPSRGLRAVVTRDSRVWVCVCVRCCTRAARRTHTQTIRNSRTLLPCSSDTRKCRRAVPD